MRNISTNSLNKILQNLGGEPINIVEINWSGQPVYYSDRMFPQYGLIGKVLEIAGIEDVVDISTGKSSQNVTIKLDDTDGSLKTLFNNVDFHNRPVTIYQWFADISPVDKFPIFIGVINTPITWRESDRTVTFEACDKLEDYEIGFSVDDGQFVNVAREIVGKPWPLPFGTVVNYPALLIDRIPTGATKVAVGIVDQSLDQQTQFISCKAGEQLAVAACLSLTGATLQFQGDLGGQGAEVFQRGKDFQKRAEDIRNQIANEMYKDTARLNRIKQHQIQNFDLTDIPIINGNRFVQHRAIGIRIGDAHYFGTFSGDNFHVISRRGPTKQLAQLIDNQQDDTSGTVDQTNIVIPGSDFIESALFGDPLDSDFQTISDDEKKSDPCAPPNLLIPPISNCGSHNQPATQNNIDPQQVNLLGGAGSVANLQLGAGGTAALAQALQTSGQTAGRAVLGQAVGNQPASQSDFFFAQAGSPVRPDYGYPIRFVASIIPGTVIIGIAAERTFGGVKTLIGVPKQYYRTYVNHYGSITATIVELNQPLSAVEGADWSDKIFVTMRSPIGPNTVDIMRYLIEHWGSGATCDPTSFALVRSQISSFPSHFVLEEKKNLIDALKEIAYQARLAIFLKGNVFYLKYLPIQESPGETISETDVVAKTLEVDATPRTEEIITQYTASWQADYYFKTDLNYLIFQKNVPKYGLHKQEHRFTIYNHESLVERAAIFWLNRHCNMFKLLKFKTFITKIRIEVMDTILLNFANNYVANGQIIGIVQKALYDSSVNLIDMEVWVPVRMGEMTQYPMALPADNFLAQFATPNEVAAGLVGSQDPNNLAKGDLRGLTSYNVTTTNSRKPVNNNQRDATVQVPPIETIVAGYIPSGVGTNENDQVNSVGTGKPPPVYNTGPYKDYKELPRPGLKFDGTPVPCLVLDKIGIDPDVTGGIQYNATVYPNGFTATALSVIVTQIIQDPTDAIIPNTLTLATRASNVTFQGNTPQIVLKYFIKEAVWE